MGEVLSLLAAALGITKATDTVRNVFDKDDSAPKWTWNAVSLVFAMLTPFLFNVEQAALPAALKIEVSGMALQVWTGLILWGLSAFGHELMDRLSPPKGPTA